jgi:hypothetical protein
MRNKIAGREIMKAMWEILLCLFKHRWIGCCCYRCGKIRKQGHVWDHCTCHRCRTVRPEFHDWEGCVCRVCGLDQHRWKGEVCEVCGSRQQSEAA